jgi:uncharacterized protein YraI
VAVTTALNDLNTRTGQSYTLDSIEYKWKEYQYNGNNLGCPSVEDTSTTPGTYLGYQIEFDTDFDGDFEWDYRISSDGAIFILCSMPASAQPTTQASAVPSTSTPFPTRVVTKVPTATPSACSDLRPRLVIGQQGKVLPSDPIILRETPENRGKYITDIPVGAIVTVLDGPRCSDSFTRFQVNYNGQVGWTIENDGNSYRMEVFNPDAQPTGTASSVDSTATPEIAVSATNANNPDVCDPAAPPRLAKGTQGRVQPTAPNNLRADPISDGTKLGQIPAGEVFNVLDGPRCAEGYTWWQVEYQGMTGWTVETVEGEYVVESPAMWQSITPENVSSLVPFAIFKAGSKAPSFTDFVQTSRFGVVIFNHDASEGLEPGAYDYSLPTLFDLDQKLHFTLNASFPIPFSSGIVLNDGSILASAVDLAAVEAQIYKLPETTPIAILSAPEGVREVVISPDGRFAATIAFTDSVTIWDITPGSPTFQTPLYTRLNSDSEGKGFAISPDGQYVFLGNGLEIDVVSTTTWQQAYSFATDLYPQYMTVSPDGQSLVVTGNTANDDPLNKAIRVYDLANQTLLWGADGESTSSISLPSFNADGSMFVVVDNQDGGQNSSIHFYNTTQGSVTNPDGTPLVYLLTADATARFSPDGTELIVAYYGDQPEYRYLQFWAVVGEEWRLEIG